MPETPHPVETARDLAHEAERGRSPRTPLIALTGVTLVVGAVVGVILAIALVVYFVAEPALAVSPGAGRAPHICAEL